jgi:hypothetical protein
MVKTPGGNGLCFKDAAATQDDVLGRRRRSRTQAKVEILLDGLLNEIENLRKTYAEIWIAFGKKP